MSHPLKAKNTWTAKLPAWGHASIRPEWLNITVHAKQSRSQSKNG